MFVRKTYLLRANHFEHHATSFCLLLPLSMQRKDVEAWLCTVASGRAHRPHHLPESRKWPKACEDRDELHRNDDAGMGLGTFTEPDHAHSSLWLCLVPHSSASQPCPRLKESGRYSLTLHPSSTPITGGTPPQKWLCRWSSMSFSCRLTSARGRTHLEWGQPLGREALSA